MTTLVQTKFAIRNFAGKPVKYFRVEQEDLTGQALTTKKSASHHVIIVDRSGSMYSDLPDLRTMVEKLLTLHEFADPSLRISLVSYSSKGDVKLHFSHVTVEEVMSASNPYLQAIRSIQATAMTCISQGLATAETLIDDNEITCITLHSDGYANDLSPYEESRAIGTQIDKLKNHGNCFVNTIAYREGCDFGLLSSISNALSGVCVQAKNIRQVYDALHGAMSLLSGTMVPAVEARIGDADYLAFVSKSARKVLGSIDNLTIRGLGVNDDRTVYRYFGVEEAEYAALKCPETLESPSAFAIPAYCRAQISDGHLNAAKYALVATKNGAQLKAHSRALVSADVAAFAASVEESLFDAKNLLTASTEEYGLSSSGPSVLSVLSILDKHSKSLSVNIKALTAGYKRRGLKKIPGVRQEDGTLQTPTIESKHRSGGEWVEVNSLDVNRTTATVNIKVSQPIDLFPQGGTERIAEVAGVDLSDLRDFHAYTLIGDGVLNVNQLMLKTSSKQCFKELKAISAINGVDAYEPNVVFAVDFSSMPLVDFDAQFDAVSPDSVKDLARLTVLSKILDGMTKGTSTDLTEAQITELKKHYLSAKLNFSPPMCNDYTSLSEAINKGQVDSRLSYNIDVGIPTLTSLSKLLSGNAGLQRRFTLTQGAKAVDKPTVDQILNSASVWGLKKLTAATKLTEVDDLSFPIYEGFLGLGSDKEVCRILKLAGCSDTTKFFASVRGEDKDAALVSVSNAVEYVGQTIEEYYSKIRPLSFYIGATGLVPDSLCAQAYTAETFVAKFHGAKLSKDELEGTFFVLPNGLVLTVYTSSVYVSVQQQAA